MRALNFVFIFSLATIALADVEIMTVSNNTHTVCRNVTIVKLTGRKLEQKMKTIQQCRVIEGYLEIRDVTLKDTMSFPNLIQVTDYVVLYFVEGVKSVAKLFPRLSVIRGRSLFHNYSLVLIDNHDLREVGPWSLKSIIRGAVRLESNIVMCLDSTKQFVKMTNSSYTPLNVFRKNFNYCPFDDCEEEGWCDAREKTCHAVGGCFEGQSCHEECLGGCNCSNVPTCCAACKHFLLKEECVAKCPKGLLKYLDYRCISDAECLSYKWVIYGSACIPTCPEGFVNRNLSGKCRRRQLNDTCEGATITSTNLGSSLKDCSSIKGNLIIMVTGGRNVALTLKRNLGKLEVISGYLRVVGANALRSLNFLSKLRLIKGEEVSHDGCTICIFENSNLEQLWDWAARNSSKLIVRGQIYVAFNERLCPGEVKHFFNQSGQNDSNTIVQSNGKSTSCDIFHSPLVAVPGKEPGTIKLSWMHNWCGKDSRTITDYSIYYRQTNHNVTIYEDRDVCNENRLWTRVLMMDYLEHIDESDCINFDLVKLQPNKRYAIYAKTHSIDKFVLQTNLVYVTTFPLHPDAPHSGSGTIDGDNLKISWKGSLGSPPEGGFYEVDIQLEAIKLTEGFQYIGQCQKFDETLSRKSGHRENVIESELVEKYVSAPQQSCSCPSMGYYDRVMFTKEKIEIENEINRLYHKLLANGSKSQAKNQTSNVSVNEHSKLCDAGHAPPGKCPHPPSLWDTEHPEFAKLAIPFNWTMEKLPDASTMQYKTKINNMMVSLPPNINMPTRITIRVRNCTKEITPCRFRDSSSCVLCSNYHSWTIFKEEKIPLLHVKVVPSLLDKNGNGVLSYTDTECHSSSIQSKPQKPLKKYETELIPLRNTSGDGSAGAFSNRMNLSISWDSSYDHENTVLGYRIKYSSIDDTMVLIESNFVCWSKLSADENENTVHVEVPLSKVYKIGVEVRTAAGYGRPKEICIQIKDNNTYLYLISIAVIIIVVLIVMIIYVVVHRSKKPENAAEIYNNFYDPFLISIKQELRLKKEMLGMADPSTNLLGTGNFGQVHKDVFIDRNNKKRDVAVKTIRERTDRNDQEQDSAFCGLLQEAKKIQEFDSPFVVKLLGVYHHFETPARNLFLVFEYMDLKDLKNILVEREDRLPQHLMEEVAIQIAAGMEHIHDLNFVHGDLAARNCMISSQGADNYKNGSRITWRAKISDFGLTKQVGNHYYYIEDLTEAKPITPIKLPLRWMAPESFIDREICKKSDVWSFGVLLWEIINEGRIPYENDNDCPSILNSIHDDFLIKNCCDPDEETVFLIKMMKRCLQIKSERRRNFHELVKEFLHQVSEPFKGEFIRLSNWESQKSCDNGSTDDGYGESCTGNSMNVSHDIEDDLATSSFSTSLGPCHDATSSTSLTEDDYMAIKRSSYLSLPAFPLHQMGERI